MSTQPCIFIKYFLHLQGHIIYAESVSLFSKIELRNFDKQQEDERTFLASYIVMYGVGLLLILLLWYPKTRFSKISFQHHAFFVHLYSPIEVRIVR